MPLICPLFYKNRSFSWWRWWWWWSTAQLASRQQIPFLSTFWKGEFEGKRSEGEGVIIRLACPVKSVKCAPFLSSTERKVSEESCGSEDATFVNGRVQPRASSQHRLGDFTPQCSSHSLEWQIHQFCSGLCWWRQSACLFVNTFFWIHICRRNACHFK